MYTLLKIKTTQNPYSLAVYMHKTVCLHVPTWGDEGKNKQLYRVIHTDVNAYILAPLRKEGNLPELLTRETVKVQVRGEIFSSFLGCKLKAKLFSDKNFLVRWQKREWAHTFLVNFWVFKPAYPIHRAQINWQSLSCYDLSIFTTDLMEALLKTASLMLNRQVLR